MNKTALAALEILSNSSCDPVMRNLNELEQEDKYSVIYEIARIETLISGLADLDADVVLSH